MLPTKPARVCARASGASRFRTFCSLLVLVKITSLVFNVIIVDLCSSDHCWASVTSHYHTLKIRCLSRGLIPWSPPLLVQFWFCHHRKLWSSLGQGFHAQLSTQCVFICTYCESGSVLNIVETAGEKKEWRNSFIFIFIYYMPDSILDANEIDRNPDILIFKVLQENLLSSLSEKQTLITGPRKLKEGFSYSFWAVGMGCPPETKLCRMKMKQLNLNTPRNWNPDLFSCSFWMIISGLLFPYCISWIRIPHYSHLMHFLLCICNRQF